MKVQTHTTDATYETSDAKTQTAHIEPQTQNTDDIYEIIDAQKRRHI